MLNGLNLSCEETHKVPFQWENTIRMTPLFLRRTSNGGTILLVDVDDIIISVHPYETKAMTGKQQDLKESGL